MCEAEDKLRKVYRWLHKNHLKVCIELDQIELKELEKEAF